MLDRNSQKNLNYFITTILLLLIIGVVMVYSSSYMYAQETFGSSYHFITKQLIYISIGVIGALFFSKTKFNFWFKHSYKINIFFTLLLVLTFIPGVGIELKGSHRWINLGFFSFQPSELIKFSIFFTSIKYFDSFSKLAKNDRWLYAANIFAPLVILVLQPDFGSFSISVLALGFACFLSDFPRKYFYSMLVAGVASVGLVLIAAPYRVRRLLTFLDPWSDPKNSGFQIIQSFLAFANGSITGSGLGNSREKLFYLPESYNDFIFSVLGEELGFIGVLVVVLLFVLFVYWGFKLSVTCFNKIGSIYIATAVFLVGIQAFLNMGVVLGLLPTKGLNLPFISYGGTSMITNLCGIGILISAIKSNNSVPEQKNEQNPFERGVFTHSKYP